MLLLPHVCLVCSAARREGHFGHDAQAFDSSPEPDGPCSQETVIPMREAEFLREFDEALAAEAAEGIGDDDAAEKRDVLGSAPAFGVAPTAREADVPGAAAAAAGLPPGVGFADAAVLVRDDGRGRFAPLAEFAEGAPPSGELGSAVAVRAPSEEPPHAPHDLAAVAVAPPPALAMAKACNGRLMETPRLCLEL